jgi:transposase
MNEAHLAGNYSDFVTCCGSTIPRKRPYSIDLRVRVVQTVNNDKKSPEEVAKQFRINPAFLTPHQHLTGLGRGVYWFLQLDRDLNNLTPLKGTGRPRLIPSELEPVLLEQIQAKNDLTLEEHCKLRKKRAGMKVSCPTLQIELEVHAATQPRQVAV